MTESSGMKNINDNDFNEVIGKGITLVDFWAPWCYPCRIQGPILESVVHRIGDKAKICKMNVDENRLTPDKFRITGIPTLIIFKDGKPARQFVGVQDENTLVQSIESLI